MDEYTGWRPASGPSPMDIAITARTDAEGWVRLRSDANHFWGYMSAWIALGLAAISNNAASLRAEDALTPLEAVGVGTALFAVSVGALTVLGRSHVIVRDEHLEVRNPMRIYEVTAASVNSVEQGLLGFPTLLLGSGAKIHVWGLGGNLRDEIEGGSEDAVILKALLARAQAKEHQAQEPHVLGRWAVLDRNLVILVVAWAIYACSFAIV